MSLTLPPLTLKSVQTAGPRFKSFPSPSDVYPFSADYTVLAFLIMSIDEISLKRRAPVTKCTRISFYAWIDRALNWS